MDEQKILLVKLPKWQLQEDIMGVLGAMFVTKLFQTAMGRQSLGKNERKPFFLYVDEFRILQQTLLVKYFQKQENIDYL